MSSSTEQNLDSTDAKIATQASPPGMNSITNTVGMHPSDTPVQQTPADVRPEVCDKPGCTQDHSGKVHG